MQEFQIKLALMVGETDRDVLAQQITSVNEVLASLDEAHYE